VITIVASKELDMIFFFEDAHPPIKSNMIKNDSFLTTQDINTAGLRSQDVLGV
jgi:hypothetical protein